MAKDLFHEVVRQALVADGWTITDDPLKLKAYNPPWEVDFAAEKLITAEKEKELIAVEVKSFLRFSFANEFHTAIGQYINYRSALKRIEPNRVLFLAVPDLTFKFHFQRQGIVNSLDDNAISYFVFH